ncbi:uncharacterized protein KD926_000635 [Aspergillus affinis]|uniref:uncharacterized protein n=1 Tax=Aspergillus affinis TaxID=1070780 RepID=UPI0022FF44AE|nr:uncharacterized protein KD926_000635 [Aspergillus affinis]KAI9037273.1 hypothetical protein KD926_000635 [Aspergillus affinis]
MPRTPQFASTPRFLLSQRGPPPSSSFSASRPPHPEAIDEDGSPQNTPLAKRVRGRLDLATPGSATRQPGTLRAARARDVIEDSEEESGLSAGEVDSELEAEYGALFGETRSRSKAKRRRVDEVERENDEEEEEEEGRNKSNDADDYGYEQQSNENSHDIDITNGNEPEPEPEHTQGNQNQNDDLDPNPYSDENIPSSPLKPPSTPYPSSHRPRFLLSASSQLHTPSQTHSPLYPPSYTKPQTSTNPSEMTPAAPPSTTTAIDSTMAPPPSTRRKPTFVLPRSPSPDTAADEFPSLFSPSRTQRRRGRQRGSGQGYVAGGMAEQVRGWVLEMGVKSNYRSGHGNRDDRGDSERGSLDGQKYAFVLRAIEVERSVMGSCGELVFVRGVDGKEVGGGDEDRDAGDRVVRNVILMGEPQSRNLNPEVNEGDEVMYLQQGDLVGVCQGLVWDVELDAMGESMSGEREKWSVCMEWDVL